MSSPLAGRIFDSSEPLRIPTLTGSTDPDWVAENEPIPDSDVTFGEILLMPSNRKSIKALTKFSNEMARQSTVVLDAVPKTQVAKDVSDKLKARRPPAEEGRFAQHRDRHPQPGRVPPATLDAASPDRFLDALALADAEVTQTVRSQRTYPLFRQIRSP